MNEEHALVRRAVAGQEEAAAILVRRLMPVIRARVRRALAREGRRLGPADGEDLVQEVWLKLIDDGARELLGFDPERGATFEGYCGMIAEREIGNLRQLALAKKRGGHLIAVEQTATRELATDAPSPEQTAEAQNLAARLAEHLDQQLPARGQLVLRYAFSDGLTPDEVAKIMGVTVQVVYNWQHKIRTAARAFLQSA